MTAALGLAHLVLGTVYTTYGLLTLLDMKRGWRQFGFSHFGAAWVAMAFTCGPHHLVHGAHVAFEGRQPGALDLFVVAVGVPFGAIWVFLRFEAFVGGRGDRFITGTPPWLAAAVPVAMVYLAAVGLGAGQLASGGRVETWMWPNMALVVIYLVIGALLLRAQVRNRPALGGWSVSGLSLGAVFPTCALMHHVMVAYAIRGRYDHDWHGVAIDVAAVPAGLYFLWVVASLYMGKLHDWNEAAAEPAPAGAT